MPTRILEKPMLARCSILLVLLLASPAHAQVWTEDAAVARALSRAPLDALADARGDGERAEGRAASAWPGLELSYTREQTFGTGATGEDYLGLALPLDLAHRRGLRGEAHAHRALAAELEVDALRRELVAQVRRAFHRAHAARARGGALDRWLAELDEVLARLRERVAAGDASRYDSLRLERERATGAVRRDVERARAAAAEAELAALLGVDASALELAADALPQEPPPLDALLAGCARLPQVRLWDEEEAAGHSLREAGARGWVPELSLALGWKGVDQYVSRSDGFYGGVVLALPIFDLGDGERERGEAQVRIAVAERELARADAERAVRTAHAESTRLLEVARAFETESEARSSELVAIASASYASGESGLLELLDAERGALEDRLALVDLALAAWEARVALDHASGDAE